LLKEAKAKGKLQVGASDSLVAGRCFHRPLRGLGNAAQISNEA
jgi:hypothetical protein